MKISKTKQFIILYASLALMLVVFKVTLYKNKQDGNVRTNRENHKGQDNNKSIKLED